MSDRTDAASDWLVHTLNKERGLNGVWCLDEHGAALPAADDHLRIISNRWDQAERARRAGFQTRFSDFEPDAFPAEPVDRIYLRVSKEKPVTHHLINMAGRCLRPGGQLILCGRKSEGAKTYIDKAGRYLGTGGKARKQGDLYTAHLVRGDTLGPPLPDSDYAQPRPMAEVDGLSFLSKPGLYGWQKIDRGSALLWEVAEPRLQTAHPQSLLDLGCGYGYLGLLTHRLPLGRRVLTDNNAAAVAMARLNAQNNNVEADVIADDGAAHIDERFDAILCNPPFHQGFGVSGDLTDRFLQSARRHLTRDGVAFFVVNQFIPLEQKAEVGFERIERLAEADGFKVVALSGPR